MSDYTATGDGIIAALQVLAIAVAKEKPMSEITSVFNPFPQYLKNIIIGKINPLAAQSVKRVIKQGQNLLNKRGRVLVRKSGTEALVRVMVEGEDEDIVTQIVDDITSEIQKVSK